MTGRLSGLVRKGRSRTPPEGIARYLMEQPGKQPTDLLPIFGQRSHVNEALNGRRKISAAQARKLAALFNVHAGLFIRR